MKILVLGCNGQLGLEFQKISKFNNQFSWTFANKKILDLSKLKSIQPFLSKINPSIIINCAAYTDVDKAESESKLAHIINETAVGLISKWTSMNNKKFIHISTDFVFDGYRNFPYDELSETKPINKYGLSKLRGEQLCLKNDPNSIILRTSWLYSSFGKNFVKTIIELMKKRSLVKVVNDQIGSPTYADDLANLIIKIVIDFNYVKGIYHYSNDGKVSWYELTKSIKKLYKLNSKIIGISSANFKTIARRPSYSVLDKTKIKKSLSIDVPDYKISLEKCIKILKSQ